ncbi:putative FBD-associated F-box protein At5g56440 isoform X2 [Mercurialis annua]|uniref:putative FBD-associated F-box protein At5g56440 isoform X2 n=1 Tax=Mercurialis annua TaxID=3986 RepID=UPI002160073C|nr:putative FBD-associated F-box protein At5g56440 isoform X2 [Mercurialis annua]
MEANQRKRKKEIENTEEDRLSELSDCLLHHIFSFTDAADVVRTCILSQRWRYLWISHPNLNFNFNNFSRVISSKRSYFINFIHQVLLRRNSVPVHSFHYSLHSDVKSSVIQSWICYAVNHQVQHLTIDIRYLKIPLHLPHCLTRCTSLTTLELCCSPRSIKLPKTFELPSLKHLILDELELEFFDGSIFSSCPNLETLKLAGLFSGVFDVSALNLKHFDFINTDRQVPFSNLEFVILAPKLMKFSYFGYPPGVLSFKNLSSLDQIEIDLPSIDDLAPVDALKQMFALKALRMLNAFHIAKAITLSPNVIQLSNLKHLKLWSSKSSKKGSVILNYFLKSSPLLEISYIK